MTFNPKIYGMLLAETLPGVISSAEEYDRVEEIFNRLMNKGEDGLSPEEDRLFDLLANLLEDYERRTLPTLARSTPLEMLKFLMSENDLKQKDVVPIFGSQGIASEVLSGKRAVSKTQAKALAERFRVSAELFI
ncbi:MAG: transcriptional regulator [Acidobacteria bacterium]|jgi:HTH-type transcriptional regulator/antitoxin HigA|nr:transcriptional regulator [Acidobacteriota bacterium]